MEESKELPIFPSPLAHLHVKGREPVFEGENQSEGIPLGTIADARRQARFKIEVDISVNSQTCGMLKGYTVDISESGISAMLRLEVPLAEVVELVFTLPFGPVNIYAIVRQRSAFRYGFEFFESGSAHEVIRRSCRALAFSNSR
jgi:PilZ domain